MSGAASGVGAAAVCHDSPSNGLGASPAACAATTTAPVTPVASASGAPLSGSDAFDEAWLNSRGSLLSVSSQQTAMTLGASSMAGNDATPLQMTPFGVSPFEGMPADASPTACHSGGGEAAQRLLTGGAGTDSGLVKEEEEVLVARQLRWDEDESAPELAATAAQDDGRGDSVGAVVAAALDEHSAAMEAVLLDDEESREADCVVATSASAPTPGVETGVEEMLAFLDEAAMQVGLPPSN